MALQNGSIALYSHLRNWFYFSPEEPRRKKAGSLANSIQAKAFAKGQYAPDSEAGKKLLAHELAHTVQQGGVQRKVQRDGGVTAGLILAGIAIVQNQINNSEGALQYSSDAVTYPKDLERAGKAKKEIIKGAISFRSYGAFTNNKTDFDLIGEFSNDFGEANSKNRVMANVYFDLGKTTSYSKSLLTFNAKALPTPRGTASDPRLAFVISGHFDPAGSGDARYRMEVEIDQHGAMYVTEKLITQGDGKWDQIGNRYVTLTV